VGLNQTRVDYGPPRHLNLRYPGSKKHVPLPYIKTYLEIDEKCHCKRPAPSRTHLSISESCCFGWNNKTRTSNAPGCALTIAIWLASTLHHACRDAALEFFPAFCKDCFIAQKARCNHWKVLTTKNSTAIPAVAGSGTRKLASKNDTRSSMYQA